MKRAPDSQIVGAKSKVGLNLSYSFSRMQHLKYNDITRYVDENDLTVSVSLYESSENLNGPHHEKTFFGVCVHVRFNLTMCGSRGGGGTWGPDPPGK